MNRTIDLEIVILLDACRRGVITDKKRVAEIRHAALDELEFAEQTAEHRERLEALMREMGIF